MQKRDFQIAHSNLINSSSFLLSDGKQRESMILSFLREHQNELPEFPSNQLVDDNDDDTLIFDGIRYYDKPQEIDRKYCANVSPTDCIGLAWLFKNDHSDGRPVLQRFARCLCPPFDNIPPISVAEMGEKWFCSDGCHRIFTAYLLDLTVRIKVVTKYNTQK